MRSPVIERLMVRGSQVALKHVIHDMETRTLVMKLRWRGIKRWVPCGDMDRRLKIPHSAKVECGFRTTPEECLYDSGLIGLQYNRASKYNTIQYITCHWCVYIKHAALDVEVFLCKLQNNITIYTAYIAPYKCISNYIILYLATLDF